MRSRERLLARTMSFTSIPILDLSLASDPATKPDFLSALRHALMEVGFLYLKNVGISNEDFKRVIEEGKAFFDLPEDEKYHFVSFPHKSTQYMALPTPQIDSRSK